MYKACLVVRSFTQQYGVDYDETYAPVARLASLRLILAITSRQDWDIDVFDFHSAFLNGKVFLWISQKPVPRASVPDAAKRGHVQSICGHKEFVR